MTMPSLDRRKLLTGSLGVACSAAAWPFMTPVTFAAAPGDARLVVIVLRGAMDGLAAFPLLSDPSFARARPTLASSQSSGDSPIDLDGRFGMHSELRAIEPLWLRGELAVVQAVATPYRHKRSHFEGQDFLETGASGTSALRDGWLNRALAHVPGARASTALSVGRENMLLLQGEEASLSWLPGADLPLRNDERGLLDLIYRNDPVFLEAARGAALLSDLEGDREPGDEGNALARFAAERLAGEARIAAFSLAGWDTHRQQAQAIRKPLRRLADAIATLEATLGPVWGETLVIAMTEFGRTVQENGSRGTDHGTGGAALLAGGALKGGRVYGDWPGIGEAALYEGRDLMPTTDVRHYPAWALAALFGISRTVLERDVFPGLDMGQRATFLA